MQEHHSGLQFGAEQRTQNSLVCSQIQSSQTSPLSHTSNYGIFSSCSLRSVERTNSLSHETVRLHELILEFLTKLTVRSTAVEPLSLSGTCCCRKSVLFPSSSSSCLLCQISAYVSSCDEEVEGTELA